MSEPIVIFQGTSGLNIVDDPVRFKTDSNGISDLQVAVNVSIDQSGRVRSRRGVTQLQEGNYHSLFCAGGDCFVVGDDTLYQVASNGSLSSIRSSLTKVQMSYAQIGDRTYYTNSFELGIIYQGQHVDWEEESYFGPETHRSFSGPMPGHHLAEFFGRMLITNENALFWSEPYNFGLFNLAASFVQFHTKIIMLKTMDSGLFLSTENNTYFLIGRDPGQWQLRKVANYPAIEGTCAIDYISGADIGLEIPGQVAVWASREGAIMGLPDGRITNLNKKKIIYPETAQTGFGGLVGYNFIHGVK